MTKVLTQFNNLILQGKINKAKKVKIAKVYNFKSGLFFKIIKYNKNMNKLTNDEINFCLLHEEGHYVNAIKIRHWAYLVMSYILISISIYIFLNKYFQYIFLGFVTGFLTLLIMIPVIRIWLSRIYQNYEYKADEYACENIDNPHEILSIFDHLDSINIMKKNSFAIKLLRIFGSGLAHPTDEDRIERIKKFARRENVGK